MSMWPQYSASSRVLIFSRMGRWRSTSRYMGVSRKSPVSLFRRGFLFLGMPDRNGAGLRKRLDRPGLAHPATPQPPDLVEVPALGDQVGRTADQSRRGVDRIPWVELEPPAQVEAPPESLRVCGRDGQMRHLEDGFPRLDGRLKSPAHPDLVYDLVHCERGGHRLLSSLRDPPDKVSAPSPLLAPAKGGVDEDVRIQVDHVRRFRSSRSYAECGGNLRIVLPDLAILSNTSAASVRVARRTIFSASMEKVTSVPGPILNAFRSTFGMTTWPFGPTRMRISSIVREDVLLQFELLSYIKYDAGLRAIPEGPQSEWIVLPRSGAARRRAISLAWTDSPGAWRYARDRIWPRNSRPSRHCSSTRRACASAPRRTRERCSSRNAWPPTAERTCSRL